MAEATDHDPESQKLNEKFGEDNSAGKSKSAEKPIASKKRDDLVPNCLRASTGSCHDACKYGTPYVFKVKPWRANRRRVSASPPDSAKPEEIQIFVDRKVKVGLQADKIEPSFTQDPSPVEVKKNVRSSRKSPEPSFLKPIKNEPRAFRKSPSPEIPKVVKKVVQSPGMSSSSPDNMKPIKRDVQTRRSSSAVKERNVSAPKRDVVEKRSSSNVKERNTSSGQTKSNSSAVKSASSVGSTARSGGRQGSKTPFVGNPRTSIVSIRKDLTPPTAASSSKRTSKVEVKKTVSSSVTGSLHRSPESKAGSSNPRKNKSPKDQTQRNRASTKNQMVVTNNVEPKEVPDEKVEEKTLHMIEIKEDCLPTTQNGTHFIQSPSPLSPESLNSSSQENTHSFTSHEVDDEQDLGSDYTTDSEADDLTEESMKEENNQPGHPRNLDSENRDLETMQLTFRRGKIIDPQPEKDSPRRLRFRQGRSLEDQSLNGGPRRKAYRKRVIDVKKEPEQAQVKVVLKHQEIEAKKDMQVLFNNVIEETASKLVVTRKSKVKALVGAFETVISLQESKKSPSHPHHPLASSTATATAAAAAISS